MVETHYLSRRNLWLNRLAEEVVRGIAERIRAGNLAAGAALPSREALVSEFVTSPGVVDRAMEMLLDEGLVSRDADGALRVTGAVRRQEMMDLPQTGEATRDDVLAILELRMGIEAEAAALAAGRRSETQLAAIREAQAAFEAASGAAAGQADFRFHRAIAEAAGNPYLHDLIDHLGPLLIPRMRLPLGADAAESNRHLDNARADHRAIAAAIAASDPDAARRAMRAHLARTTELVRRLEG